MKKKAMLELITALQKTNEGLIKLKTVPNEYMDLLTKCQEKAIQLGTSLEENYLDTYKDITEDLVGILEIYCESIYQLSVQASDEYACNKLCKKIQKLLLQLNNKITHDIPDDKKKIVFLPYKASMWDSLESVWKAAARDDSVETYVIPIPYFERKSDGMMGEMRCEADLYPEYVPITKYDEFDFGVQRPDVVFIHNPYDEANYVTVVHPFFHSKNLKKYTDCLVYIPYYATTGGMSEGQRLCPAYIHADYIVIQAEKYRKFFDERIPDEKFLAFGSPKFDSVIWKCQNPPKPPKEWEEKMAGKKVYFYNTSIGGMLENTGNFLKKMEYVFDTFKGREDACLLWRPHPLLESTFNSMRVGYKEAYNELKKRFIDEGLGIYDTTPDIESTIALSDAYIGDTGTSVTALFGVAGKPIFVLDNWIHVLPGEDDWRGIVFQTPSADGYDQYCITQGNKLYYSPKNDFKYEYFCDLSEYSCGWYYLRAIESHNEIYVFPRNAQHILVVSKEREIRRIDLISEIEQPGAFNKIWTYGDYVFLCPCKYPSLVRFNTKTEKIDYITGLRDFNVMEMNGEMIAGASGIWEEKIHFISADGNKLVRIDIETLEIEIIDIGLNCLFTEFGMKGDNPGEIWLLPYEGTVVTKWNYLTGNKKEYDLRIDEMKAVHKLNGMECNSRFFGGVAFLQNEMIFSPHWGNMFVKLNPITGETEEWNQSFMNKLKDENGYFVSLSNGFFITKADGCTKYRFFCEPERKLYNVDFKTNKISDVEIIFNKEEICNNVQGFSLESQWMQYSCREDAFNTLQDFLDDNIQGSQYDRKKQLDEFEKINASVNGECGEKVFSFVKIGQSGNESLGKC